MFANRQPRGISLNKNALNIQSNILQQQQQLQGKQPLKTPSPPQLKSHGQLPQLKEVVARSENDDLGQFAKKVASRIPRLRDSKSHEEEEIEDIDKTEGRDAIFQQPDVAKDIYSYMYELEEQQSVRPDFLKDQKIFTPRHRQRLINWCIEVHYKLKLLPETLYTTTSIIDRYFSKVIVKQQSQVQLVACGCTLIASKYEEIYPPELNDLIIMTQNAYSKRDIMRAEIEILQALKFDLGKPIPLAFLRRFSRAAHCDLKMHSISKFLMEISLTEYECSHWSPSLLAAAALFTTKHLVNTDKTLTSQDLWNKTMVHYSRYSYKQLQDPASTLCKILKKVLKSPQSYTVAKRQAMNLTKWVELKSPRVDDLIV